MVASGSLFRGAKASVRSVHRDPLHAHPSSVGFPKHVNLAYQYGAEQDICLRTRS
jgi:hypothetical protein